MNGIGLPVAEFLSSRPVAVGPWKGPLLGQVVGNDGRIGACPYRNNTARRLRPMRPITTSPAVHTADVSLPLSPTAFALFGSARLLNRKAPLVGQMPFMRLSTFKGQDRLLGKYLSPTLIETIAVFSSPIGASACYTDVVSAYLSVTGSPLS